MEAVLRRAVLTIGGTVAGLAALFSFKSHSAVMAAAVTTPEASASSSSAPAATPTGPAYPTSSSLTPPAHKPSATKSAKAAPSETPTMLQSAPTAPSATPASTARASTPPTSAPATHAPSKQPTTPAPATSAPAGKSGTFTGPTENTQYGQVEVQIVLSNGKITSAADLASPADSIGANAVSQLNSEVVSAQSANVQSVSGATYTSQGYIASLQSAVDQAGL